MTEKHAAHIDDLLRKSGASASEIQNNMMEGIRVGNRQIVEAADAAEVRDASMVAAAQISLHDYIGACGTLAARRSFSAGSRMRSCRSS